MERALALPLVDAEWTFDLWFGQPSLGGASFAAPLLQFSMHIGAEKLGKPRVVRALISEPETCVMNRLP